MKDLVDTTEMYLRTIFELEEEGVVPLRARIAERLEQSGPTVSQTVSRMERDGLLKVLPDRSLDLTAEGRNRATAVMRKHRLAERLLTDILGLDIHRVHEEACRWEHVMSVDVERRVVAVLRDATLSPFGNPIPGLEELGVDVASVDAIGERALDMLSGEPTKARVVQINEILQMDHVQFNALNAAGIRPGTVVTAQLLDNEVTLISETGESVVLDKDLAHALRLAPLD